MQQQLGRLAVRIEQGIAGDRAVADEVAVEIRAHRRRELAQLVRLARFGPRAASTSA